MASRKPNSMYRYPRGQATTRREYMGGVPASRITQFIIGNKNEKFPLKLSLIADEKCQIRHSALESARITMNRVMEKKVGMANYRLKVLVYPHIVIRENKQATGAGADRVSQGMRRSYGKPVGVAARVFPEQILMTLETTEPNLIHMKEAARRARMKLPTPCTVKIEANT